MHKGNLAAGTGLSVICWLVAAILKYALANVVGGRLNLSRLLTSNK